MTFVRVGNHLFDIARVIHVGMYPEITEAGIPCIDVYIHIDGDPDVVELGGDDAVAFVDHISGRVTTETRDVPGFGHVLDLTPRAPTTATGREESPNRQPETA